MLEEHSLSTRKADRDGEWEELALALSIVSDPEEVESSASTVFLCDVTTQETMAYRLALFAPDTSEEADCVVWGAEADWESQGHSACEGTWPSR